MKHGQNNNRRQRSRGNGRRYPNQKGGSFDSSGPEAKVRGTAQQVLEKYQALARDAYSAGDRILAEGYMQHAEHYYRILNTDNEGGGRDNNRNRQQSNNRDGEDNNNKNEDNQNAQGESRANDQAEQTDKVEQADKADQNSDDGNGLQRTMSRGRGGNGRKPDDAPKSDEGSDEVTKSADGEDAEAAPPRKPRARRPRKTEQSAADSPDQSAAD